MSPILRVKNVSPLLRLSLRPTAILRNDLNNNNNSISYRRHYSQGDYGGQNETSNRQAKPAPDSPTRQMEHPGPNPSPNAVKDTLTFRSPPGARSNASQHAADSCGTSEKPTHPPIPSNQARPTLNDGRQSPNVDRKGNRRDDVSEDVNRHNEELSRSHDRSYNVISDQGEVTQGFRSGGT